MSNSIERLLQFIEYKGDSRYKFYKKTGLSNGFLDKNRNIGSDKCEIISVCYPDISLEWLITGKGKMLREESAPVQAQPIIEKDCELCKEKNKTIQAQQEAIVAQQKNIKLLEEKVETLSNKVKELSLKKPPATDYIPLIAAEPELKLERKK